MSKDNNENNQEINEAISLISEKILNEIVDYIQVNFENPKKIIQKLAKIYKYINNTFSNNEDITSENICTVSNEENQEYNLNNFQQNTEYFVPNNRYLVFKLRRQLKKEQEKNKLRELDYLEKLYSLQKELRMYKGEKNSSLNQKFETQIIKDRINDNFINKGIKNEKCYSVSSIKFKQENKKETTAINIKANKTSSNGFNTLSKINSYNDEKPKIGRNNYCMQELVINNKRLNNVFNKTIDDFMDKYRMKMYSKAHQKIKNINCIQKYDFNEIKESVEKGRKKIRLIKDGISPALFQLRNMKIDKI